jgi:hypothetical protein
MNTGVKSRRQAVQEEKIRSSFIPLFQAFSQSASKTALSR